VSVLHGTSPSQPLTSICNLKTAPFVTYKEIIENLPICAGAWTRLLNTKVASVSMGDIFQSHVYKSLRAMSGTQGFFLEKLILKSRNSRAKNPIIFVMRFSLRLGQYKEGVVSCYSLEYFYR
jgi:hypothetical protein